MDGESFQKELADKKVDLYTLENNVGLMVQITNYGGKIVSIICPDKNGDPGDVCLGYESLDDYVNGAASLGATMGPYANRMPDIVFVPKGFEYLSFGEYEFASHRLVDVRGEAFDYL